MWAFIVFSLLLALPAESYADHGMPNIIYLFPGLHEEINLTVSDCGPREEWFIDSRPGHSKFIVHKCIDSSVLSPLICY